MGVKGACLDADWSTDRKSFFRGDQATEMSRGCRNSTVRDKNAQLSEIEGKVAKRYRD